MLQGKFNQSEFFTALRSISFHKRQGVLEIATGEKVIEIILIDGMIVEVRDKSRSLCVAIVAKLKVAGLLSQKIAVAYIKSPVTVSHLEEDLVDGGIVSADDFNRAKNAYELDLLYSIRSFDEGDFLFSPGVVRLSHDYSLEKAPGHLMLDLVEMSQGEEGFNKKFGGISDVRTLFFKKDKEIHLMEEEHVVINNISDEGDCLKSIYNSSLICENELRILVSSLAERGVLEINAPHLESAKSLTKGPSEVDKHFPATTNSVDDYISAAASKLSGADELLIEQVVVFKDDSGELIEATESEAREILGDKYQERLVGESANRAKKNQAWQAWAKAGQQSIADNLEGKDLSFLERLHNAIIYLNYKLMEPKKFEVASVMVLLVFFIFLCFLAPGMLQDLMLVVEEYSALFSEQKG